MGGDEMGSGPDQASGALEQGAEPLGEGDEVEFVRAKTHFREELSVSKGQRGVIQALAGAVCQVQLEDGRIVTACAPTDLKAHVRTESSWGSEHCKYMIRKGYLLDEEVPGVVSPRVLALTEDSFKAAAAARASVREQRRPGDSDKPAVYAPFRKPVGATENEWQLAQLKKLDGDNPGGPRPRTLKSTPALAAMPQLYDSMLCFGCPTGEILDNVVKCAKLGVDPKLLTHAKRRAQRREVADRAKSSTTAAARPRFRGDCVGAHAVAMLIFFLHHTDKEHLCSMDVEETDFDEDQGLASTGTFVDIDGAVFDSARETLVFFCESQDRFMAQRYYQGDGSDPMRKDKVNAAMEFIEERLLSRDHATGQLVGPWAACMTSMLGNADREAELDFLLKSVKHADRTLFFMSYKEIHEREKLRKQAREDRIDLVHQAVEALVRKLLDRSVQEINSALNELDEMFLQEKFIGGPDEVSIADFLLAPIVFCLRHRGVAKELKTRLPTRFETWLNDFEAQVPYTSNVFFKVDQGNDIIDSLNEYLTERTVPFKFDRDVIEQKVMEMSVPAPSRIDMESKHAESIIRSMSPIGTHGY
jgi:hypothetical protein